MAETNEYVLGTAGVELRRLESQHQSWTQSAYALWERAGFGTGQRLMDLGCGPGFTSLDLARLVGPSGRVIARDQSEAFLAFLEREARRRGLEQIEVDGGPVEALDLAPGELDGAYARWLFCWLPDPGAALARVARGLRPGGALAVQDYLDWGAMKVLPRRAAFDAAIRACLESFRRAGGHIDVGEVLPELARECGLRVEHVAPVARIGRAGSLEWRWIGDFLHGYLPKLVETELFDGDTLETFRADWRRLTETEEGLLSTPVVVDLVLRKPES